MSCKANLNADWKEGQTRVAGRNGFSEKRLGKPYSKEDDHSHERGCLSVPEIAATVGERTLDYHLHQLELAELIDLKEEKIALKEAGVATAGW
jgi:hypothetical protein